jgi:hypothetical protein
MDAPLIFWSDQVSNVAKKVDDKGARRVSPEEITHSCPHIRTSQFFSASVIHRVSGNVMHRGCVRLIRE